jgi:hypothetical protein
MVKIQVRVEDVVDVLEAQAGGAETVEPVALFGKANDGGYPKDTIRQQDGTAIEHEGQEFPGLAWTPLRSSTG